jgi:hypothetical protein
MIYRGPGYLALMIWFLSLPPSQQDVCRRANLLTGEGEGGGGGAKSYDGKKPGPL